MKKVKLIVEIDEEDYNFFEDRHIEYDLKLIHKQSAEDIQGTLALLRIIDNIKNAKPLQAELEEEFKRIKADVYDLTPFELIHKARILNILDNHISELKGENDE